VADTYARTAVCMDTLVTFQVVRPPAAAACAERVERAFGWFREVEQRCSRFDPTSELRGLSTQVGKPVAVSPLLYEAVQFALSVARASGGAFDPTLGHVLEAKGFQRNYQTGESVSSGVELNAPSSYRDVRLDPARRTITLRRPLVLDLGAVAKGLAIDLAARELGCFADFSIDAGGDLWTQGKNAEGEPWSVGILNPCLPDELIDVLRISDMAVCTSGGYERPAARGVGEHHLLDPRSGRSPRVAAGVSVIAPAAMLADALGTAAFVLGPRRGLRLLERYGVEGLIVTPSQEQYRTTGFSRYQQ
jgi:thiamine biosynthesis lipoprotein